MGESASELAGLQPRAYWFGLQVPVNALMGTTTSTCNRTASSCNSTVANCNNTVGNCNNTTAGNCSIAEGYQEQVTDNVEGDQSLTIGLLTATAAIVLAVFSAALGWLYYSRRRQLTHQHIAAVSGAQKEVGMEQKEVGMESATMQL